MQSWGFFSSYTWRSLWEARWIIEKGSRWRIGNGRRVQIWKDRWLLDQNGFRVWSPCKELNHEATVSELIDDELKMWNQDLVRSIFDSFEAEQLVNIPLSNRLPEDQFIWHFTKDGRYTVKTVMVQGQMVGTLKRYVSLINGSSESIFRDLMWKKLWSLHLPPKVKSFAWRACKSI